MLDEIKSQLEKLDIKYEVDSIKLSFTYGIVRFKWWFNEPTIVQAELFHPYYISTNSFMKMTKKQLDDFTDHLIAFDSDLQILK